MKRTSNSKSAKLYKKKNENFIVIKFPYEEETLHNVRSLSKRKYHKIGRFWICVASFNNMNRLIEWGFDFDPLLESLFNSYHKNLSKNIPKIIVPNFHNKLYGYQKVGVSFIEHTKGRCLIADEMGLGKTIQVLGYIELHEELKPVIIVCPASLKLNWEKECNTWLSKKDIIVISGAKPYKTKNEILIINYDILDAWKKYLKSINPKLVVFDECHYFKNNTTKRTKAVKYLSMDVPHIICLSGTPIVSRPIEIFNAINLIDKTIFSNKWAFMERYCALKHNGYGWDSSGASNTKELNSILSSTVMIRRLKKDVLKELPEITQSSISIEIDNRKEYTLAESNFETFIQNQVEKEIKDKIPDELRDVLTVDPEILENKKKEKVSKINILTEIESLKQLAVKGKINQSIKWIEDFIESDEKLVIFATHKFVIDMLMNRFEKIAVKIDGSVSMKNRQMAIDEFQTNKNVKLFIGNSKAAGVGITLTAASYILILELPWTASDIDQMIGRIHRIGMKKPGTVYFLLAHNTIEESICELLDKKRKITDSVLDGMETEKENLLTQLIKKYKK